MRETGAWQYQQHQRQGGEQHQSQIDLAQLRQYRLAQFNIGILMHFIRVMVMHLMAIQMHMHRNRRLLPIKTKMPMRTRPAAEQPEHECHKGIVRGEFGHRTQLMIKGEVLSEASITTRRRRVNPWLLLIHIIDTRPIANYGWLIANQRSGVDEPGDLTRPEP